MLPHKWLNYNGKELAVYWVVKILILGVLFHPPERRRHGKAPDTLMDVGGMKAVIITGSSGR
jgi:hypothetical protein